MSPAAWALSAAGDIFQILADTWTTVTIGFVLILLAARLDARIRHGRREAGPRHPARRWAVTDEEIRALMDAEGGNHG